MSLIVVVILGLLIIGAVLYGILISEKRDIRVLSVAILMAISSLI